MPCSALHVRTRTSTRTRTHVGYILPLQPKKYNELSKSTSNLKQGGHYRSKWALQSDVFAYSEREQRATLFIKSDTYAVTGVCALDSMKCKHRMCAFANPKGELHSHPHARTAYTPVRPSHSPAPALPVHLSLTSPGRPHPHDQRTPSRCRPSRTIVLHARRSPRPRVTRGQRKERPLSLIDSRPGRWRRSCYRSWSRPMIPTSRRSSRISSSTSGRI